MWAILSMYSPVYQRAMSVSLTHACLLSMASEVSTPPIYRALKAQLWSQNNREILPVFLDNIASYLDNIKIIHARSEASKGEGK